MRKKEIVKMILMGVIIIILFMSSSFVLNRQTNIPDGIRVKNFYLQKKNSLDVVLIGASTSYTDFSSPVAWEEYGFTSYSLGTPSAPMGLAKSMLQEVRKNQEPKIIAIDINGILYNDKEESRDSFIRVWLDNMPYNKTRLSAINELVPESDRMSYYIPLIKYHTNIARLDQCVKETKREIKAILDPRNLSVTSMAARAEIVPQKDVIDINDYQKRIPLYDKSGNRLKELLDYCKSNNLNNVVFTNMPRFYSKKMLDQRARLNTAKDLIESYGYKIYDLDYNVEEIGLDKEMDFYNANHVNIYGQIKITRYLSERFTNDFNLKKDYDQRTIKQWDEEYKSFMKVYEWADNKMKLHAKNGKYNYKNIDDIINY